VGDGPPVSAAYTIGVGSVEVGVIEQIENLRYGIASADAPRARLSWPPIYPFAPAMDPAEYFAPRCRPPRPTAKNPLVSMRELRGGRRPATTMRAFFEEKLRL